MYNADTVEKKLNTVNILVHKYHNNLHNIPKEEQESRYKNAFIKLRKDIIYAVAEYTYINAVAVYIPEGSSLYKDAAELVKKALPGIMHILWNGGEWEGVAEEVRNDFLDNYYFPSMQRACVA